MNERLHHEIAKKATAGLVSALGVLGISACDRQPTCGGVVEPGSTAPMQFGDQQLWVFNNQSYQKLIFRQGNPLVGTKVGELHNGETIEINGINVSVVGIGEPKAVVSCRETEFSTQS